MTLYDQVADYIESFELLVPRQALVVAVSGGADSVCLLDCLVQLGYQPLVAHLDHALRPESHRDAEAVADLASRMGHPFVVKHLDPGELEASALSLEHAARLARYRFLANVAGEHNLQVIATGHTADDQVETILLHLLRGTGPGGLRGMLPRTTLEGWGDLPAAAGMALVRPLLGVTHDQAVAHCTEVGLAVLQDESNFDLGITRNRIRYELLPSLEAYNPAVREALLRLAEIMRGDVDWQERQLADLWPQIVSTDSNGTLNVQLALYTAQHPALQRVLARALLLRFGDADMAATERLRSFLSEHGSPHAIVFPGGLRVERGAEVGQFYLPDALPSSGKYPQVQGEGMQGLSVPGEIQLAGGWRIFAHEQAMPAEGSRFEVFKDKWRVALNAALAGSRLEIRGRRPGDHVRPLGMSGTQKLSDLMINHKLPRTVRARWPLVVEGEEVLWVAGLVQAERTRVPAGDDRAIVLELIPPGRHKPERMDSDG
jgi:tRNA(Ile)-lysidine synthase